jgi:hypothetical protein
MSPALGHARDPNYCSIAALVPPGSKAVTRGEIVGAPNMRAPLMEQAPWTDSKGPTSGYLISGDRVDFVTECNGYSYVRFHGKSLTTSGWVDSHLLQLHGQPYIPLPADAAVLCSAAESSVNSNFGHGSLKSIPSIPFDGATIILGPDFDPDSHVLEYTPVKIGGRPLAAVQVHSGGSCGAGTVYFWTSDLKHQLSPDDVDARNPFNEGSNGWDTGLHEKIVTMADRPMLFSALNNDFALSQIDRTGDTQLVCHGRQHPMSGKPIVIGGDRGLCESIVSASAPVVMQPATNNVRLLKESAPNLGGYFKVIGWLKADLDNTGVARPVGVFEYHFDSGVGCSQSHDFEFPILLDNAMNVDPSDAQVQGTLRALFGDTQDLSMGSQNRAARIVNYKNQIYVEILDTDLVGQVNADGAPVQSIWAFKGKGPQRICELQTKHYEVKPPVMSDRD